MRVLAISHSYVAPENQKNLDALGARCQVRAVVPHFIPDTVFKRLNADAYDSRLMVYKRVSLPRSQYLLLSLDMGMKEHKPDIIHIEYDPWSMIFWQMTICRLLFARGAKVVCTVKKNTYRKLPWPLAITKKAIARFFICRVDRFIAVSGRVKAIYQEQFGVSETKVDVIQHLGVDTTVFHPSPERLLNDRSGCTIGYCGRFDENKGIHQLLDAVAQLYKSTETSMRLKLLGRGPLLNQLRSMKVPWLELLDPIPHAEVAEFMQSLDVFVMPSRITPDHEEHDGHALMEALACGVASVGSTSGVIPELLANDVGLIYTEGNTDELTDCIRRIASDRKLQQDLATNAVSHASEFFSLDGIANRKIAIYHECLSPGVAS